MSRFLRKLKARGIAHRKMSGLRLLSQARMKVKCQELEYLCFFPKQDLKNKATSFCRMAKEFAHMV